MLATVAAFLAFRKPVLTYRWVYVGTNLQVSANVTKLETLMERARKAGYNGFVIADSKLERLGSVSDVYFKNAAQVAAKAKELGIALIPCMASVGYADGLLSINPNLIESEPVRGAEFVAHGSEATFSPEANAVYRNGGFEDFNGDTARGMGFQDNPGTTTFADRQTKHGGNASLRMTDPVGNCRVEQEIAVVPHRQYHLSVWLKSSGLDRQFEIKALDAQSQPMSEQDPAVKPTQDWTEHHLTFNSGDSKVARIYMGFWGGHRGSIWIDDAKFEEVGLLNVVRRPSCPVTVRGDNGTVYKEGTDYAPIVDPRMGSVPWPGAFEIYHPGPSIQLVRNTRIREAERLRVDFDHAVLMSDGKTSICLSDPATQAVIADTAARLEKLWHPSGFFLAHDEIRSGGTCDGCVASGKTPGKILADNLRMCVRSVGKVNPGAETYVWNDMFDPAHNAVAHYYLTKGTLEGSWEGLPKETVVVNWNFGQRQKSMAFFAGRGNRQVLAGYYDHDPAEIRTWLNDAANVSGISGVMYTTWQDKYDDLEAFARAAWGQ